MNSRIDNIKKEGTVEVKEYFYFLILLLWDIEKGAGHLGRGTSQGLFLEGRQKEARTCDTRKPTMPNSPLYWPTESDTKFGESNI
jgi:hypothetical protein